MLMPVSMPNVYRYVNSDTTIPCWHSGYSIVAPVHQLLLITNHWETTQLLPALHNAVIVMILFNFKYK